MALIVGFLVAIAVIGALLYTLVVHREVPGAVEQRFGTLEPLPPDVGRWKVDLESEEGKTAASQGLAREVRLFHDVQTGKLKRQARYKNPATNVITRVDADVVVPRRRLRA